MVLKNIAYKGEKYEKIEGNLCCFFENVSKTAQYTDTKCRKWCKFQRRKSPWKNMKKNDKSHNFQTALNQSIKVQIVFWVVQKIALDIFRRNPELHEYRNIIHEHIGIFRVRCRFLTFLKNFKNGFSLISFEQSVLRTIWHVKKKTYAIFLSSNKKKN